jgi:ABC-type antimicrobial peptide transport system permease subunit
MFRLAIKTGLLAALFPAFRASRMNVLDAISHS